MTETENVPASDIYPDVYELLEQVVEAVNELVKGVETLDANNWLAQADKIDSLNNQLVGILIPQPKKSTTKK